MNNKNSYDFIIAGMGLAGLSLAMQLKNSKVNFTKVLLIDKNLKNKNDRTWCFWSKENENWFDKVIFKRWSKFKFTSSGLNKVCEINPYQYCMIKGIDFYNFCLNELKSDKRFEFVTNEIKKIETKNNQAYLHTSTDEYQSNYLFNSAIRTPKIVQNQINYVQHFKGWLIETEEKNFDVDCPTFMDFNIHQKADCRFVYVLPFGANKALIEYTGFSPKRIDDKEYDAELTSYIKLNLKIENYKVLEEEQGEIPMYESEFVNLFGNRVINIGTSGGSSKTSTGFTFYFVQKHISELVNSLANGNPVSFTRKPKYLYYDRILMDVIDKKKMPASDIFETLFKKIPTPTILAFLNEESSLIQELRLMNSVPKLKFVPAALRKI